MAAHFLVTPEVRQISEKKIAGKKREGDKAETRLFSLTSLLV